MSTDVEVPQTMHIEQNVDEPQQNDEEQGERKSSPRELIMQGIAARAEEQRQNELAQALIYDQDAREAGLTFQSDDDDTEQSPSDEASASVKTEQPQQAQQPQETNRMTLHTVNVNGQMIEVTDQQYQELANLGMIANVALHSYNNEPQQPVQEVPQQRAAEQPLVDPDFVREVVRKIQFGGEEDGATALTQLIAATASRMPQPQPIDQQAIVQQAVAQAQRQAQFNADTAQIQQEYKEVFADPQRTQLAAFNVNAIRQRNIATGRVQSDLDVYREAGNAVYDALRLPRPNSETANQTALQAAAPDRLERKRAAPSTRTQMIDRRATMPSNARGPSGSEIVDRMRTSRGQPSMM